MNASHLFGLIGPSVLVLLGGSGAGADPATSPAAGINTRVLNETEAKTAPEMVRAEIKARTRLANQREDEAWAKVKTAADWEKFRDARLEALRRSLGSALAWAGPTAPKAAPAFDVTGTVPGDGFRIQNLVIAGRPGLPITGNLYVPDPRPKTPMPVILICTSHHNGKTQGELLDMGMTWARNGAMVLVIDNIGYVERKQQPYGGREDYRWRYYLGMQLYAVSESLIGWVVDDLHRGIDVLLAQPGADASRVIAIGSVASGGDAISVLAAFDRRITCVIPFNFGSASLQRSAGAGGPEWVSAVSGGDYETTRCLRNSARDGFVPWVIVAAPAPRHLIFAKEFAWDAAKDAGFARITRVFDICGAKDRVDSIHGYGQGDSDPKASPASNVGPAHRKPMYPILERWMKMPVPEEYRTRPEYAALTCLTPEAKAKHPQRMVYEIAAEMAQKRLATVRATLAALPMPDRKARLRKDWARVLGEVDPAGVPKVVRSERTAEANVAVEKILLAPEPGILVPTLLLTAKEPPAGGRRPVVICVSQHGKGTFLRRRTQEINALVARGVAVCLPDVRGTGETATAGTRYWYGPPVEVAAEELMLGRTILGSRLRDLRAVLRYLETRPDLDMGRVAVWGDSFEGTNPQDYVDPPMMTKNSPEQAEPLGAQLALLAGLYEDQVQAILARGGLVSFASVMDAAACHVILDAIVPQVFEVGDLCDVAAVLAPRPLRIEAAVDGRNRLAGLARLTDAYALTRAAYGDRADRLRLSPSASDDTAAWLAACLKAE